MNGKNIKAEKSYEKGGFKFAVATLTAVSTFLYISYGYFQNTAVNGNLYSLALVMHTVAVVSILILVFYIFIKGFAIEIQDSHLRNKIERFASDIYQKFFLLTIILIIYSILFYYLFSQILSNHEINNRIIYLLFALVGISSLILYDKYMVNKTLDFYTTQENVKNEWPKFEPSENDSFINRTIIHLGNLIGPIRNKILNKISSNKSHYPKLNKIFIKLISIEIPKMMNFFIFCCFYLLFIYLIIFLIVGSFMPGDVHIDIENTYYKSSGPIPVSIKVTGPDTGLLIKLLKENSDHNLTLNDSIKLESIHNSNNTIVGENSILVGNSLGNGMYNIFINNTNLDEGYYELVCFRNFDYIKSFYLLNK